MGGLSQTESNSKQRNLDYLKVSSVTRALLTLWSMKTLPLLAALLFGLLDLTEGAKGSVRAGMMSRTNRRRNPNRLYDSSWDGNDQGYPGYERRYGEKNQCNEVCQYNRLIGLESGEDTTTSTTEESQTESSTEPCIGLCQLEKTNKIEKDPELNSLQSRKSKRCVGLCYILRKKGQVVDPHLEELQKRRPCVGLCYLLKKKKKKKKKKVPGVNPLL